MLNRKRAKRKSVLFRHEPSSIEHTFQNHGSAPSSIEDDFLPRNVRFIKDFNKGLINMAGGKCNGTKNADVFSTEDSIDNVTMLPGMSRNLHAPPVFKQTATTSDAQFLRHVNSVTKEHLYELRLENKYDVNVVRDSATGKKRIVCNKGARQASNKVKWRRQKHKKRRQNRLENSEEDFGQFSDPVRFGEVVQCPPVISRIPRSAVIRDVTSNSTKTRYSNMLLSDKLKSASVHKPSTCLSPYEVSRLDEERSRAITAYREMKERSKENSRSH